MWGDRQFAIMACISRSPRGRQIRIPVSFGSAPLRIRLEIREHCDDTRKIQKTSNSHRHIHQTFDQCLHFRIFDNFRIGHQRRCSMLARNVNQKGGEKVGSCKQMHRECCSGVILTSDIHLPVSLSSVRRHTFLFRPCVRRMAVQGR